MVRREGEGGERGERDGEGVRGKEREREGESEGVREGKKMRGREEGKKRRERMGVGRAIDPTSTLTIQLFVEA